MFDFETLRLIWWFLLGFLLAGFAIFDGFDFGVGALLPWLARTDSERRVVINTIGPVWEGNQTWIILGAGAIFAAFPPLYGASFSGFYLALIGLLFSMILRPGGFKYRSKLESPTWRTIWDHLLFVGGVVPPLLFGVAVGNVLQGVPFHFDEWQRLFYDGSFFGLLNPFALLCGLVSVSMVVTHGAVYLVNKTDGAVQARAIGVAGVAPLVTITLFLLAGLWVAFGLQGYVVTAGGAWSGPSNPFTKTVELHTGAWLANYRSYPWMALAPMLGFGGAVLTARLIRSARPMLAFVSSGASIFGIVSTAGVSMFPFLMPSSNHPNQSLTVFDASSSHDTLMIMLISTIIFMPIIIIYTGWVFKVMRGTVSTKYIDDNSHSVY
jgi:cytochrome d ubiquinol oxidase subunit II